MPNTTISPGDDYYDYVNQTWLSSHEIPADKAQIDYITLLADDILLQLKTLFEQPENPATTPDVRLARQFYTAAMDTDAIEARGGQALQPWLDEIGHLQTAQDIQNFIIKSHGRGHGLIWDLSINIDDKDSKRYVASIYQDGLSLPDRDYYLETGERFEKVRQQYQQYLSNLFKLLGYDQADARSRQVFELETTLAKASQTSVEVQDDVANYHKYRFNELPFKPFDWQAYAQASNIPANSDIIVAQPDFLQKALDLLTSEPVENWQNYLLVHTVQPYLPMLAKKYADLHFGFYKTALNGIEQQPERYKTMISRTINELPLPVGHLYVDHHFDSTAKQTIQELVGHIQSALRQRIEQLDWMGAETKQAAYAKLNTFLPLLGYPDTWRLYEDLKFSDDYFQNVRQLNEYEWRYEVGRLQTGVDRHEWFASPAVINAFYWPNVNTITFPAGILQPPFFDPDGDFAANYGAIGSVIGHEISHGFDNNGSEYDLDGNLRFWWTEQDRATFDAKAAQLAKQFDTYEIDGRHVNGKLTLGENIGDLGGVLIAFNAMQQFIAEHPDKTAAIDGQSPAQRFFAAQATTWCGKKRPEIQLRQLMSDPHSPEKFRVNGVITNVDAWYAAYDVQPDDKLYQAPEDRVRIW